MTEWTLTFKAEGAGPPVEVRVRNLLKRALRSWGLRCVTYMVEPPAPPPTPPAEPRHRRQLPRELGRGEDEQPHQDAPAAPEPPRQTQQSHQERRSGVKPTQTTSEGETCGKSDCCGSRVHPCCTRRGSVLAANGDGVAVGEGSGIGQTPASEPTPLRHRRQLPRSIGRGEDEPQSHADERNEGGMASQPDEGSEPSRIDGAAVGDETTGTNAAAVLPLPK